MDIEIQRQINIAIQKLQKIDGVLRRDIKGDLGKAGKIILTAIKSAAPKGEKTHRRYKDGRVVAIYKPANLKRSIRQLPLRRAKSAVYLGPLSRGGVPDGFYARFIEGGTKYMTKKPFILPATEASFPSASRFALELLKRRVEKYANQVSV